MFQRKKSLEELEEERDYNETAIEVRQQEVMLAELNKKGGDGFWKRFSSDGSKKGISWDSVKNWLKTH